MNLPSSSKSRTIAAVRTEFEAHKIDFPELSDMPQLLISNAIEQQIAEIKTWAAVGRVASAAGVIEQLLNDIIWTLARVDHDFGACLTSQYASNYNRFSAIEALMLLHGASPKMLALINKFSKKWKGLGEDRNRIIHDPLAWNTNTNTLDAHRVVTRPQAGLVYELKPIDFATYIKIGNDLQNYFAELVEFKKGLLLDIATSEEKSAEEPTG